MTSLSGSTTIEKLRLVIQLRRQELGFSEFLKKKPKKKVQDSQISSPFSECSSFFSQRKLETNQKENQTKTQN